MEIKVPDGLPVEVSMGMDPMDVLVDCAVQSSGDANGCIKGHVSGVSCKGDYIMYEMALYIIRLYVH